MLAIVTFLVHAGPLSAYAAIADLNEAQRVPGTPLAAFASTAMNPATVSKIAARAVAPQASAISTGSEGGFDYAVLSDSTVRITRAAADAASVPAVLGGLPVSEIGDYVFERRSALTHVVLPATLTKLGNGAFRGSTGITTVTVQGDTDGSYTGPFDGCANLNDVVLAPGVTRVGDYMFKGSGATNVGWVSTLTTIGAGAFSGCASITVLPLQSTSVRSLGDGAFERCAGLVTAHLPSSLEEIGAYAFSGCERLNEIVIPEGVISLGADAFYRCWALERIVTPDSLTSIGTQPWFSKFYGTTIWANIEAYATPWAIDHGVPLRLLDTTIADSDSKVLDRTKTYYTKTGGGAGSGYSSYQLGFEFKPGKVAGAGDLKLQIRLPKETALLPASLMLDGVRVTNYREPDLLEIPITKTSGVLKFTVTGGDSSRVSSYSKLSYKTGSTAAEELIGVIAGDSSAGITLVADAVCGEVQLPVSGFAPSAKRVELWANGSAVTTVTASQAGNYSAKVTLPSPSDYKRYVIEARTTSIEGTPVVATSTVLFRAGVPQLRDFQMYHNAKMYRLSEQEGRFPAMVIKPHFPFGFTVKIDNREQIDRLWVASDRGDRRIELQWSESQQAYVGVGVWDADNPMYVPGSNLWIEYSTKYQPHTLYEPVDFTSDEYVNTYSDAWRNASLSVQTNTATDFSGVITLANSAETKLKVAASTRPLTLTPEQLLAAGYTEITQDSAMLSALGIRQSGGRQFAIPQYSEDGNSVRIDVADTTRGEMVSISIGTVLDKLGLETGSLAFSSYGFGNNVVECGRNALGLLSAEAQILSDPSLDYARKQVCIDALHKAALWNAVKLIVGGAGMVIAIIGTGGVAAGVIIGTGVSAAAIGTDYMMKQAMQDAGG